MSSLGGFKTKYLCKILAKRFLSSKELTVRPEYLSKLREYYCMEEKQQIVVPQFKKALLYGNSIAVKDSAGEYTYFQLYMQSKRLSRQISNICGSGSCSTIGVFLSNDVVSVLCIWACWMAGQVVMPLSNHQDYENLQKFIMDSKLKMIVSPKCQNTERGLSLAQFLGISHLTVDHLFMKQQNYPFNLKREIFMTDNLVFFEGLLQNNFYTKASALLLFLRDEKEPNKWHTVRVTHKQLNTQLKSFIQTLSVTSEDRFLAIFSTQRLNSSLASALFPLNEGCCLQMVEPIDTTTAWGLLMGINTPLKDRVNVVITEPKVYCDLITEYDKIFANNSRMVEYIKDYCSKKIRLMISCIVKLPTETYTRWLDITGHPLLESDICSQEMIKKLKMDWKECKHPGTANLSLTSGNVKFRIVDFSNNILLESNGKSIKKIHTSSLTTVGCLWISSLDAGDGSGKEAYYNTGDVVMYQNGIFTFVGRSNQH